MKKIKELEELEDGINVVKFYSDWCNPCKRITPMIDELEKELSKAKFYKVNIGNFNNISTTLGISSIPTIMILKDKSPIDSIVGFTDKSTVKNKITKHL